MNHLLIGNADKTDWLLNVTKPGFLLIDDGPIADAFLERFTRAKLFDVAEHHFNPLKGIDYKRARDIASAIYTASPQGQDTLTVRNGKRALTSVLLQASRLDRLDGPTSGAGYEEAVSTVDDILLSPVVKQVLCSATNFSFKGSVVAKIDRAQLGDFDAFILASLLIGQCKGQVIVPDGGFYVRDFYTALIRQERLTAGLNYLAELPVKLQQSVLLIKDKVGNHCTFDDATTLADYAGLTPGKVGHTEYVQNLVEGA